MTIFRIPDNGARATDWRDLNRDGTVSWVEKAAATAGATFLLCLGAWTLLQFLYVGACFLFGVKWAAAWDFYMPRWFGGTIVIVAGAGLALFVWRMVTPEKSERLAKAELEYQRKKQQLDLERDLLELDNLRGVADHEPGATYSQIDIDAAARLILLRYYRGQEWSRDKMVAAGVVKKPLWDDANHLLKSRNIRKGNKIAPEDFAAAWGMYVEGSQKAQKREWKGGGLRDTR